MLVAQFAQLLQVALFRWKHSTSTLQRFGNDCSKAMCILRHEERHRFNVVGVNLNNVGKKCSVPFTVGWNTLGAGAAIVGAVVPATTRNNERAFRVSGLNMSKSSKLHCRVDTFRATVAEKNSGVGDG